jgi:hypothetical protein
MAFNTKIRIDDQHVEQVVNSTLTLSGDTRYATHPNFTGDTQIIDKKYVDDNIISATGSTVYDLLSPSACAVGGITVGYVLTGKTSNEIIQDMLFPELFGALNPVNGATQSAAPSVSLSPSNASLYEVGCSIPTVTINASFSRGTINPQYCSACSQRSGPVTTHYFSGPQITTGSISCTTLTPTTATTSAYVVTSGVNSTWGVCVATSIGTQPKSNKNNNFSSPLPANTSPAGTAGYIGAYPIFATTVAIGTLTKQALQNMATANAIQYTVVAETGGGKQKVQIPCAWLSTRPLIGVCQYNTVSSQWEYPGGSAAASLALWTPSSASQTIQSSSIGYCQYQHNAADRNDVQIRLVF